MRSNQFKTVHPKMWTRRQLLHTAALGGAGAVMSKPLYSLSPTGILGRKKTVVVTFGGGARDEETFAAEGQENIPHMMNELIPQATFCTQVINQGILGHYVATASLATGVYETFDNFANVAPTNPTVFEYYRKELRKPTSDAWVIAPSNGFNRIGESNGSHFSSGFGAQVVLPKLLLSDALGNGHPKSKALNYRLQDSYENPLVTPFLQQTDVPLSRLKEVLDLSVEDFIRHAQSLTSADELSVYVMRRIMKQFAPSLLWITLHDMDVAHSGAYSLYIDGIRRTDRLCSEIWQMIESDPEYKGRTTMLVLPDFGRDSDFDVSGNGFQHHRTGDPLSRTTWLMALGPHIRQNMTVDRPLDSLDLVPTLGALMGFQTPGAKGKPISEIL
jgi:hypothetical protein